MQKRFLHDIVIRTKKVIIQEGTGGRSSNDGITATVFGATGMLGRTLVNTLGKKGTTVVTPYRGTDDDRRDLRVMADLGKLVQLRYDLRNEQTIAESLRHSDIVYNCIGRAFETKNFSFDKVHHEGARRIARIARENGVSKFVHVSALGADVNSPSAFLKSKALGEIAVKEEFPEAIIIRPGWMYGYEDRFWNKMGWFAKWSPFSTIPMPNYGNAKMNPVYVADVADLMATLAKSDLEGKKIELYGPKTYTFAKLVELFQDASMRPHYTLPLPTIVLKQFAAIWSSVLAFPILAKDEVVRMSLNDSISKGTLKFEDFNIYPHTCEETIHRFASYFRDGEFSNAPYRPLKKKYSL